jgi:hypothetical protein
VFGWFQVYLSVLFPSFQSEDLPSLAKQCCAFLVADLCVFCKCLNIKVKVKVKISLLQAVEAHRVARAQGSHITWTNG